jgi:hypothetical protein
VGVEANGKRLLQSPLRKDQQPEPKHLIGGPATTACESLFCGSFLGGGAAPQSEWTAKTGSSGSATVCKVLRETMSGDLEGRLHAILDTAGTFQTPFLSRLMGHTYRFAALGPCIVSPSFVFAVVTSALSSLRAIPKSSWKCLFASALFPEPSAASPAP